MILIPLNCQFDAIGEHRSRSPSELSVSFTRVDSVALVMSLAVTNMGDQRFRLSEFVEDDCNDQPLL